MRFCTVATVGALLCAQVRSFSLSNAFSSFNSNDNDNDNAFKLPKNLEQVVSKPMEGLSPFATLVSGEQPEYSLRMRAVDPEKLGIDSVKQWSGYLDYKDSKHFFYWFFESRNDPQNDPIILWLNGGPGCSSFTGLFFELGPSSIGVDLKPVHNPHSWNNNASIIFLEQPLGVGFSYGDDKVTTTSIAGKDAYIFLDLFFEAFPQLRKNDFHIAGESYAGHYIPQIAHEIVVKNEATRKFNLTSIMIGNGITDTLIQSDYYQPMACGEGGYHPIISPKECQSMKHSADRCRVLNKACYSTRNTIPCFAAMSYCNAALMRPFEKTGLNIYDIRQPCEDQAKDGMCYYGMRYIDEYMNLPYVQEALGSDVSSYSGCNDEVFTGFTLTGDEAKPFQQFITELLDREIPVLIYAGDKDFICNWLGNQAWTNKVDWRNQQFYEQLPLRPWKHSQTGEEIGQVKNLDNLTFLRVFDAGHMVPYDQPESSLEMVNRWISGHYSLGY